jgi:hypothetical protein
MLCQGGSNTQENQGFTLISAILSWAPEAATVVKKVAAKQQLNATLHDTV